MRPVHVIHIIDYMGLGGAEMMLFKLLAHMDREQFKSEVISLMPLGPVGEQVANLGLPVHILGMQQGRPNPTALGRIVRLLRTLKPDLLQTWMVNADLVGLVAGRIANIKRIVWNIRGSDLSPGDCSRLTWLAKRIAARLSAWPTLVIANSEAGRRAHRALGYHPVAWHILPNGFDLAMFRPEPALRAVVRKEFEIPVNNPLVGIVGRSHPVKDHMTFVQAAEHLHALRPDVHFLMIGEGLTPDNNKLTKAAPQCFSSGVLHLMGPRRDMPRLLASLDVFVLTSLSEGFPNVVGEAMASGVPCVVAETAGDAATIVGETGVVLPPQNPAALAMAIKRLLEMPEATRRVLGDAARDRVREHYALPDIVSRYEQLYQWLIHGETIMPKQSFLALTSNRPMGGP
jgi:glycosyltransferase involved in cell wall biosynthesis